MKRNLIVKANIILCVIMSIFSLYQAIIQKHIVYVTCSVLWADLAIIQVMYELTLKNKEKLIDAQRNIIYRKIMENANLRKEKQKAE